LRRKEELKGKGCGGGLVLRGDASDEIVFRDVKEKEGQDDEVRGV
jgi:hypothetical protein